jgi:cation diffusion facilitator CzcD-associated flavoprotein CzcO
MSVSAKPAGLDALEAQLAKELAYTAYPAREWVLALPDAPTGTLDCAIVGGGQFGQAIAFGLKRERVANVVAFDRNEPGLAGPWMTFARMNMLRTPKDLTGTDLGIGSLTFRAWYAAQNGDVGWEALERISRPDFQAYLNWHQRVTGIDVRAQSEVLSVEPVGVEGKLFRLTVSNAAGTHTVHARTVVFASGAQGSGASITPDFITKSLPRTLYSHANDQIDFDALKGKRIGILGAGAAAFDNAATALEHGAASAQLCFRRVALPLSNPRRWMEFSGYLAHYPELSDAARWATMQRLYSISQPPPAPTFRRVAALKGFALQPATPWLTVAPTDKGTVRVSSTSRTLEYDHLIIATGMTVDMTLRPELAHIAPHVALWGDRYKPPPALADTRLEKFPYLGRYAEFLPKTPASPAWVSRLFTITRGATLSMGPSAASNSNVKYTVPRIVSGVTRALFIDGEAGYWQRYNDDSHRELPEELVLSLIAKQEETRTLT